MRVLSEGVSYDTVEDYSKKLVAIRDNYFTESAPVVSEDETDLLNEEIADDVKPTVQSDQYPSIAGYADSLSRSAAK